MAKRNYDCRGWATKFGVLCGDGRTIMPGAFREQDEGRARGYEGLCDF